MWDIKSIKIVIICKKYSNYPRVFVMVKYNILYQKSFKLTGQLPKTQFKNLMIMLQSYLCFLEKVNNMNLVTLVTTWYNFCLVHIESVINML